MGWIANRTDAGVAIEACLAEIENVASPLASHANRKGASAMSFERIVRFERGYDCIKFECVNGLKSCKPGSGGSHGAHGLQIRFVLKGDEGAIQFLLFTGLLPKTVESTFQPFGGWCDREPFIPCDLGYHSKKPRYDGVPR